MTNIFSHFFSAAPAEMGGVVPFRKLQGPLKEQEIRIIAGEVPPDLGIWD